MFKKVLAAAAASLVLATPAFAATNNGFESSDLSAWLVTPGATLTRYGSGDSVDVTLDVTGSPTQVVPVAVNAAYGNYFGVLTSPTAASSSFTLALQDYAAVTGDIFAFSLISGDAGYTLPTDFWDDTATVSFYAGSTLVGSEEIKASDYTTATGWPQTPWVPVWVPGGTTTLVVQLTNGDEFNPALVALDYQAATPVPEPESAALMMAGLGALGFMSRRRMKKAA